MKRLRFKYHEGAFGRKGCWLQVRILIWWNVTYLPNPEDRNHLRKILIIE